jgi:hypothetical protein
VALELLVEELDHYYQQTLTEEHLAEELAE